MTTQAAGQFVSALVESGHLVQVPDPSDGRARLVSRTAAGTRAVRLVRRRIAALEATWADQVGPQRYATFRSVLRDLKRSGPGGAPETGVSGIRGPNYPCPHGCSLRRRHRRLPLQAQGFVFPCGEIYGGTRSAWDTGPWVSSLENIKRQWWKAMVQRRGRRRPRLLDHPAAADVGRIGSRGRLSDPLIECLNRHKRHRMDHLQEAVAEKAAKKGHELNPDDVPTSDLGCPDCGVKGQWTEPASFNMMPQDLPGRRRRRVGPALPAAGDRAGHLHQLPQRHAGDAQEAALRHRPDRQELPQRDHAGQLHLPHPRVRADGDGVLRQARRRRALAPVLDRRAHLVVRRPRHRPRQPAAL